MASTLDLPGDCRYADSATYGGKFRALQQRALSAVRARVYAVLRHACEQVEHHSRRFWADVARPTLLALPACRNSSEEHGWIELPQVQLAIREGRGGSSTQKLPDTANSSSSMAGSRSDQPSLAEADEAALLYVRFRAAAESGLKGALRWFTFNYGVVSSVYLPLWRPMWCEFMNAEVVLSLRPAAYSLKA